MPTEKKTVAAKVQEFIGSNIQPPELIPDPVSGQPVLIPAAYKFEGEYAEELERIARGASAASGIVPTPEDLTGEVMAQLQAMQEQQGGQAPPEA